MALTITPYPGQGWTNDSEPDLSAETLNAVDAGITLNSEAINAIANAIVNQFLNDPEKIASAALVYALKQSLDTTNSNLNNILPKKTYTTADGTFTSLDDLYLNQIAVINTGNDGSKTPTGKDGLALVFNHQSAGIQLYFDWNGGFKRRLWWGGAWGTWI